MSAELMTATASAPRTIHCANERSPLLCPPICNDMSCLLLSWVLRQCSCGASATSSPARRITVGGLPANSTSSSSTSAPPSISMVPAPHTGHPTGSSSERLSTPHAMQRTRTGRGWISSVAASHAVPSATSRKPNSRLSGTTRCSAPMLTRTRVTGRSPATSTTVASSPSLRPSSCMGGRLLDRALTRPLAGSLPPAASPLYDAERLGDELLDHLHRPGQGGGDGVAQAHLAELLGSEGGRLAAHHQHPGGGLLAHAPDEVEDRGRGHRVRLDLGCRPVAGAGVRLDDEESARLGPAGDGVDEDHHPALLEQRVGEVEAADAEVDDAHPVGLGPAQESLDDLDAEGVVAEEDVADAGDEDARCAHSFRGGVPPLAPAAEPPALTPPRSTSKLIPHPPRRRARRRRACRRSDARPGDRGPGRARGRRR